MGEILHDWILGMTAAAIIAACAKLLTPSGPVEKVTGFVCSLMLTTVLISPLTKWDTDNFFWSMDSYHQSVTDLTENLEERENQLVRAYIESQYAAYILDEAHVLGVTGGEAEVNAKWGNENWIPYEASLTISVTPEQKQRLSTWMTLQLGIPKERQYWHER